VLVRKLTTSNFRIEDIAVVMTAFWYNTAMMLTQVCIQGVWG